ncbi:hypothetical protein [Chitinophaga deserti]|uniref:hypothetical protein n=1 Tax=Chitinophaga deserti TaxID=2164099 RepID=UPI000D6ADF57|nr:hypothetical protein [Chitinophaga deserti]
MAILDSLIPFTGRLGNIIAYKRNGKHCLRTVPEKVRQTANTRRAAKRFGAASSKGALIRHAITPHLDIHTDHALVNRLNSLILQAGRNNHAALAKFRFNGYTGINTHINARPVFTKDGKLHIPAQEFKAFAKADRIEIKLIATRIDFTTRTVTGSDTAVLNITLNGRYQYFEGADMQVNVPGKGTLIVVLQVRQFKDGDDIGNRRGYAADIIAIVEEEQKETVITKVKPVHEPSHPSVSPVLTTLSAQNRQVLIQRE